MAPLPSPAINSVDGYHGESRMQTIKQLEAELHEARRLRGYYGVRRDGAMERFYRDRSYALFCDLETLKRT